MKLSEEPEIKEFMNVVEFLYVMGFKQGRTYGGLPTKLVDRVAHEKYLEFLKTAPDWLDIPVPQNDN